jgi:CheY-like chemotaxis protein
MSNFGKCQFYRESDNPSVGIGLGYCDLAGDQAICEGDIRYCDKSGDLRKQLLEEQKKEGLNQKGEESQKKKSSHYRVLVVDDQEPMGKLVALLLARLGHQCITARNGAEALNKILQNKVDAVISDIVMPEMDGIVLTKKLLSLYPRLPIMIMTAHGKEYSVESALMAGARDFIEKPFSIEEFAVRFYKMMRDHGMFSRMEARQNEITLHPVRKS